MVHILPYSRLEKKKKTREEGGTLIVLDQQSLIPSTMTQHLAVLFQNENQWKLNFAVSIQPRWLTHRRVNKAPEIDRHLELAAKTCHVTVRGGHGVIGI